MLRINLLDWRRRRLSRRRRQLGWFGAVCAFLVVAILAGQLVWARGLVDAQGERNQYLQSKLIRVQEKVEEGKHLAETAAIRHTRIRDIERRWNQRLEMVPVLLALTQDLPSGLAYQRITIEPHSTRQEVEQQIILDGVSQSNDRVSALMATLKSSRWFKSVELNVINTADQAGQRLGQFQLVLTRATVWPEQVF